MKRRHNESGFALLMVFLMAACVAIMLYMEMPRVAFEAERQKELLLVDRGNQFKRAIQVFETDKKNNPTGRYPASIDELENFNNHRYLRRKYVDPMTGKDEWRLIHMSMPGVFPDSVAMQQPNQSQNAKDSGSTGSNYINVLQSFDAPSSQQQGGVNPALRRRPSDSDGGAPPAGGSQGGNGDAGGGLGNYSSTGSAGLPGAPGVGLPGQSGTGIGAPGATTGQTGLTQPCTVYIGGCPPSNTGPRAGGTTGLPGQAGNTGNLQGGVGPMGGMPGMPGGVPGGLPGQPGGVQPNQGGPTAAAGMIQNLLTSPRPGGMPATNPGTIVGGGIAGVASKFEGEGIMVINDRTAINEWEYVFDSTKYRAPGNPLAGGPGTPMNGSPGTGTGTGPGVGPGAPGAAGPGAPGSGTMTGGRGQ